MAAFQVITRSDFNNNDLWCIAWASTSRFVFLGTGRGSILRRETHGTCELQRAGGNGASGTGDSDVWATGFGAAVICLRLARDNSILLSCDMAGLLVMWAVETGVSIKLVDSINVVPSLACPPGSLWSFAPVGQAKAQSLVFGTKEGLKILPAAIFEELALSVLEPSAEGEVQSERWILPHSLPLFDERRSSPTQIVASPSGNAVVAVFPDNFACVVSLDDAANPSVLWSRKLDVTPRCAAFLDARTVVIGLSEGRVEFVDEAGLNVGFWNCHDGPVTALAVSLREPGVFLATGGVDTVVKIWEIQRGVGASPSVTLAPAATFASDLSLSPSWSMDLVTAIFGHDPVTRGERLQRLCLQNNVPNEKIPTDYSVETILRFLLSTEQLPIPKITYHHELISSLEFSTDGRLLSAGFDGKALVVQGPNFSLTSSDLGLLKSLLETQLQEGKKIHEVDIPIAKKNKLKVREARVSILDALEYSRKRRKDAEEHRLVNGSR